MNKDERTAQAVEKALNRRFNMRRKELKQRELAQTLTAKLAIESLPKAIVDGIISGRINPCNFGN